MAGPNYNFEDTSTNEMNAFKRTQVVKNCGNQWRGKSLSRNQSIKTIDGTLARTHSTRSVRSLARTTSMRSRKSRISLDEKTCNSARKVAISSLIFNIGTIIVAQLSIAFKHFLLPETCYNADTEQNSNGLTPIDDINCSQIFEIDVDALDNTFVSITLFSVIFDLPANLMLIAALKLEMGWLFLPWLVVTKVKILGCVFVSCLLMHYIDDISSKATYQRSKTNDHVSIDRRETR